MALLECPECGHTFKKVRIKSCPKCGYKGKVYWPSVLAGGFSLVLAPSIGVISALLSDNPIVGGDLGGVLCLGIIALIGLVMVASLIQRRKW